MCSGLEGFVSDSARAPEEIAGQAAGLPMGPAPHDPLAVLDRTLLGCFEVAEVSSGSLEL